ncbi:MAG TPA: CpsD/CapB family tyrosine-protein kinase [Chloroflexota bacterium]|nr:CpsD/CapB family tyrosine-protein kinase [Chloroflexota bacterium]
MNADLVTLANPRSAVAEAYRTLRTNVQLSSIDEALRTLLVTSAGPDEGKSTTLANLGVAFAQAGHRTILVDSDLRRPSLHALFGIPNDRGLTTMLLQDDAPAPLVETPIEGLRLLPSGPVPPNPSELLASRRLEGAIARLVGDADLVLFDSPPALAVSDAAVLSRRVDGVVLVVSAGRTRREHAARARQVLERAGARLLGVVLTNASAEDAVYSYGG